jgi:tRNA(Leu) C34 or U34 (ribose-2'-O)-methylase TrmL
MRDDEIRLDDLMTLKAFAARYPDLGMSEAQLRWLFFNRESRGLDKVFIKNGRRVLIVVPRMRDHLIGKLVSARDRMSNHVRR